MVSILLCRYSTKPFAAHDLVTLVHSAALYLLCTKFEQELLFVDIFPIKNPSDHYYDESFSMITIRTDEIYRKLLYFATMFLIEREINFIAVMIDFK